MLSIVLPWPNPKLHPNSRVHWAKQAPIKKLARSRARRAARDALLVQRILRKPEGQRYTITLYFYQPARTRKRDLDGMLSAMKPALDGIADTLNVDDSLFDIVLNKCESTMGADEGYVAVIVQ